MRSALITIQKREIINSSTTWPFAKEILASAYKELLEQLKFTTHQFKTWEEVKEIAPEGFAQIESNTTKAFTMHIYNYKGKVPTGLFDITNSINLNFNRFQFNIIEADFTLQTLTVSLSFISDKLTLIDNLGDKLLVTIGDNSEVQNAEQSRCFLFQIDSSVSIYSYKQL